MSKTTENLGLFKYDPSTDGAQTFNIEKALNENWDKLDAAVLLALTAAAPYSAQTYALGAYCTRGGRLYRCTTAITAAETWTAAHWAETTVVAELIAHINSKSNPHGVTAAQTGAYSKGETDTLLAKKIAKDSGTIGRIDASVLDDYKESGVWNFEVNEDNPFGVGTGVLFTLVVHASKFNGVNPSVMQTAIGTHSNGSGKMFKRSYYAARGWTDWERIATATDLDTKVSKSGDAVNGDLYLGNKKTIVKPHAVGSSFWSLLNDGDFSNSSVISMYPSLGMEDSFKVGKFIDGVANEYTLLHSGNAQILGFPKIAIGSYVGTGTYSSANPNSLTFDFEPKVVIIVQNSHDNFPGSVFIRGQTLSGTIGENYISNSQLTVGWSGNTVTWYTNNSSYKDRAQLNISGNTYFYIALG